MVARADGTAVSSSATRSRVSVPASVSSALFARKVMGCAATISSMRVCRAAGSAGGSELRSEQTSADLLAVPERGLDAAVCPLGVLNVHHDAVVGISGEVDDDDLGAPADAPELSAFTDPPGAGAAAPGPPGAGAGKARARRDRVVSRHHPRPDDPLEGHIEPTRACGHEISPGELHTEPGVCDIEAYRHRHPKSCEGSQADW